MKSVILVIVFVFRDVYSDEIGYQIVFKLLEDIVKEIGVIVIILVFEQYKFIVVEVKIYGIFGWLFYVISNVNGDILWIGKYMIVFLIL